MKQAKDVACRYSKVGYLILENFIEVKVTPHSVRMKQLESAIDVVKHILQNEDSHNERADLDLTQILFDEEVVKMKQFSLYIEAKKTPYS